MHGDLQPRLPSPSSAANLFRGYSREPFAVGLLPTSSWDSAAIVRTATYATKTDVQSLARLRIHLTYAAASIGFAM
ncbi:MAG: hypothetical protein JWN13_6914 [Betaproteobacteria bacterium]|nr:hypothetical protein [Betaproteobacteria bacterium]